VHLRVKGGQQDRLPFFCSYSQFYCHCSTCILCVYLRASNCAIVSVGVPLLVCCCKGTGCVCIILVCRHRIGVCPRSIAWTGTQTSWARSVGWCCCCILQLQSATCVWGLFHLCMYLSVKACHWKITYTPPSYAYFSVALPDSIFARKCISPYLRAISGIWPFLTLSSCSSLCRFLACIDVRLDCLCHWVWVLIKLFSACFTSFASYFAMNALFNVVDLFLQGHKVKL